MDYRNGEICSRAIREKIYDWKERMEDKDLTGEMSIWIEFFFGKGSERNDGMAAEDSL